MSINKVEVYLDETRIFFQCYDNSFNMSININSNYDDGA